MNIAMEQTEEYVNGQLRVRAMPVSQKLAVPFPPRPRHSDMFCECSQNRYGDAFIRGNNGALTVRLLCTVQQLMCPAQLPMAMHVPHLAVVRHIATQKLGSLCKAP